MKKQMMFVLSAFICLVVLCGVSYVSAGDLDPPAAPSAGGTMKTLDEVEPRMPIPASDTPVSSFNITQSGSYYLTGNRSCSGNGILVSASNVTIDLMGYTLDGSGSTGSGIYMSGRSNVEIRNGTVWNFGYSGINGFGSISSKGHRVINIRAVSNGQLNGGGIVLAGSNHLVKDCTATGNATDGIWVSNSSTVTGNTCYSNGNYGICAETGSSTITGNTCYENSSYGIYAEGGSTISGNTSYDNKSHGISAWIGSTVAGNTCYGNSGYGIKTSISCLITGNTVYQNTDDGIYTSDGCTVSNNAVQANVGNGIKTGEGCIITGNSVHKNSSNGIHAAYGSCMVMDNTCCSNTSNGISVFDSCKVVGNNCYDNGYGSDGAGILASSNYNHIEQNHVSGNDRGIDVDGTANCIVKNTAVKNADEYDIVTGNKVGTISTDPITAGPWDNFDF